MRRHIVLAPTSDRYIVEVPDMLYLTKQFTSTDPGAGAPVPLSINTGRNDPPIGVEVVRMENLTNSTAIFYETVSIPAWTFDSKILTIPNVTGLDTAIEYKLTIRVSYA